MKIQISPINHLKLSAKLVILTSIFLVFTVGIVSLVNSLRYSEHFLAQTMQQTQQVIEQIGLNVDTYLDELFRLSLSPYYDDAVMADLEKEPEADWEKLDRQRRIESFLGSVMILPRNDILRCYILTDTEVYSKVKTAFDMQGLEGYRESAWYREAKETEGQLFIPAHTEDNLQVFSVVQALRSKKDNSRVLGVIKVDANYKGIKAICDKVDVGKESALLLLDQEQNVIYRNSRFSSSERTYELYTSILNETAPSGSVREISGQKYIINTSKLGVTGWTIAFVNSFDEMTRYSRQIIQFSFFIAILCIVGSIVAFTFILRGFLKPLFEIVSCMKKVQSGDLNVCTRVKSYDEIGYLGQSFNAMIVTIQDTLQKNTQLAKQVYESQYLQKQAQYDALCSQIKPHFINNMLNTISLLIKCGETALAIQDIGNLSYYLRGIMNTDKDISLSSELKIVDSYLGMQRSRYGDQLAYSVDVAEEYMAYILPALTIQPLVENAVVHGCEKKRGSSQINIFSTMDPGAFVIHVVDNGAGIEEEQLLELQAQLKAAPVDDPKSNGDIFSDSIGLLNVNRRVKLKFGLQYGVEIQSSFGNGTEVTLRLPFSEKGD